MLVHLSQSLPGNSQRIAHTSSAIDPFLFVCRILGKSEFQTRCWIIKYTSERYRVILSYYIQSLWQRTIACLLIVISNENKRVDILLKLRVTLSPDDIWSSIFLMKNNSVSFVRSQTSITMILGTNCYRYCVSSSIFLPQLNNLVRKLWIRTDSEVVAQSSRQRNWRVSWWTIIKRFFELIEEAL